MAAEEGTLQGYKSRVFEATKGKTRSKPVSAKLKKVLDEAARAAGVTVRVTSGGQAAKGTPGPRTGSTRHDLGNAADLQLEKDGRVLDFTNAADRAVFETFVSSAAANGATGIGAGTSYMGPNTIHVGFGSKSIWGAGGKAVNAPDWLKSSVKAGWNGIAGAVAATGDLIGADGAVGIQGKMGSRTIKPGMKGEDVRALQTMLRSMGANIKVDGDYGPQTRAAVETFQNANGLKVDGIVGRDTRPMLAAAAAPNGPNTSLEARDEADAARQAAMKPPTKYITPQGLQAGFDEPAGIKVPPGPTFSAPPRGLTAPKMPTLTGSVMPGPDVSAETRVGLSPVAYHSAPKRTLTTPPASGIDGQLARQNQALRDGWSIQAARQKAGIDPVSVPTPRANPRYTQTAGANSPFADPSLERAPQRRPDFDFAVGSASAPVASSIPRNAPTAAQFNDRFADPVHSAPKRVLTNPTAAAATAVRQPDPNAMSRVFDIRSNYQPAAAPKAPAAGPNFDAVFGAPKSLSAVAAATAKPAAQTLTQGQQAAAARYTGLAAHYAQQPKVPAYQPVAPMAAAPIPRPNPLAAPQVMGATPAPAPQQQATFLPKMPLGAGMLASMALGPVGGAIVSGMGLLNKAMGAGFDPATAAMNARVASGVKASDMVGNGASYGRRQSDGSVTGTTSRGTGYTSRDGGREISIGGRTYEKKSRGYSLKV